MQDFVSFQIELAAVKKISATSKSKIRNRNFEDFKFEYEILRARFLIEDYETGISEDHILRCKNFIFDIFGLKALGILKLPSGSLNKIKQHQVDLHFSPFFMDDHIKDHHWTLHHQNQQIDQELQRWLQPIAA